MMMETAKGKVVMHMMIDMMEQVKMRFGRIWSARMVVHFAVSESVWKTNKRTGCDDARIQLVVILDHSL